jgi:ABC-type branched-subunit amino acid transport system substrate-binding protein
VKRPAPDATTTIGAPVPLTGRYATQGAQMRAGLELWARRADARLHLIDDASDPRQAAEAHRRLRGAGCSFVVGPYGSDSTRAVASSGASLVWNHGAAADDVQRLPGVVSLPSPASRYLIALGRAVAHLRPGAAVAVLAAPGRFARLAREALEREARALGLAIVEEADAADAVLCAGPVDFEVPLLRELAGNGRLAGGVSPGLAAFPSVAGFDPEGLVAPVQWHPELGGPEGLEDYVAAQAYAACLVAERCLELDPGDPLAAARALRTTTFFGGFELAPDGLQTGHRLSVVRWTSGRCRLLLANAA